MTLILIRMREHEDHAHPMQRLKHPESLIQYNHFLCVYRCRKCCPKHPRQCKSLCHQQPEWCSCSANLMVSAARLVPQHGKVLKDARGCKARTKGRQEEPNLVWCHSHCLLGRCLDSNISRTADRYCFKGNKFVRSKTELENE